MYYSERHCRNAVVLAFASIGAMLIGLPAAHAQTATQITSASGLSASDSTLTFTGSSPALTSYTGTKGGNTLTIAAANGTMALESEDSFGGAFASGTKLLETKLPDGEPSGPLTITFTSAVQEFGFSAQDIDADTQTFNFDVMSSAGPLGSFSVGPSDNTSGVGQTVFLGASAPAGFGISSVTITSASFSDATGDNGSNMFAVGPITFKTPTAAPEPSDAVIWISGGSILAMLALSVRRRTLHA